SPADPLKRPVSRCAEFSGLGATYPLVVVKKRRSGSYIAILRRVYRPLAGLGSARPFFWCLIVLCPFSA
ncbi:hypothetical protein, partial [Xanthomonas citri]|uniref:hypothetical protein n=1 Tax=Xanthomonas citri TaxID=346 RepID=UPI0035A26EF6